MEYCQAQGPTPGTTLGEGQGQDMVNRTGQTLTPTPTQKWDLSYTLKLVFTTTHHTISKCVFKEQRMIQDDLRMTPYHRIVKEPLFENTL